MCCTQKNKKNFSSFRNSCYLLCFHTSVLRKRSHADICWLVYILKLQNILHNKGLVTLFFKGYNNKLEIKYQVFSLLYYSCHPGDHEQLLLLCAQFYSYAYVVSFACFCASSRKHRNHMYKS